MNTVQRLGTSDSISTSLFVLTDPENMGIVFMTESLNLRHFLSTSGFEPPYWLSCRCYTHVFGVGQHEETSGNTVQRLGTSEIKDGGH